MSDSNEHAASTVAERITLTISIVILVGILSVAVWSNVRTGEAPPDIVVEVDMENVREGDAGFYVPFTITNNGGMTAQDLVVAGELDLGDGEPETADVTVAFLAGGETEEAEMVFSAHPADGEFTISPTSFLKP